MRLMITGAGSGIGLIVARTFLQSGSAVALCDRDDSLFADVPSAIRCFQADVSRQEQTEAFVHSAMSDLGGVDVLINNAGVGGPQGNLETLAPEEWRACIATGLHGMFYASRAVIPAMKKQRSGCIINMSSNAGQHGLAGRAPYVACKWAVIGLTKTMAMELGEFDVRVNAICPGSVAGERIDRVIRNDAEDRGVPPEQVRAEYLRQSSLQRFAKPEDIAALAMFLASDAGAHISGQAIAIDGHTETLGRIGA